MKKGYPTRDTIFISQLSLINFRNYKQQELTFAPGIILIQGNNGHGKSNLLEALYMLAIAKSDRTTADRELIRIQNHIEENHAQVLVVVESDGGQAHVQIDLLRPSIQETEVQSQERTSRGMAVQKYLKFNGVPKKSSEIVGQINVVMFSADG